MNATQKLDQSILQLIPQPSKVRNYLAVGVFIAMLSLIWFSKPWLEPSVIPEDSVDSIRAGNWAQTMPKHNQVITLYSLVPQGAKFKITDVSTVPGAELKGVWVFPDAEPGTLMVDPGHENYDSGEAYLKSYFIERDLTQTTNLPITIEGGEPAQLLLLWEITDCSKLNEYDRPKITLQTILRYRLTNTIPDLISTPAIAIDDFGC